MRKILRLSAFLGIFLALSVPMEASAQYYVKKKKSNAEKVESKKEEPKKPSVGEESPLMADEVCTQEDLNNLKKINAGFASLADLEPSDDGSAQTDNKMFKYLQQPGNIKKIMRLKARCAHLK